MYAGFPGSAHDNRVLSRSGLPALLKDRKSDFFPQGYFHIIGHSAFSLAPYLLVPFKDYGNLSEKQKKYNKKLSKTRVIIENAFGLLKGRFRHLKYIDAKIKNCDKIVVAACVLHNICLNFPSNNIEDENNTNTDNDEDLHNVLNNLAPQNETGGAAYRDLIMNTYI